MTKQPDLLERVKTYKEMWSNKDWVLNAMTVNDPLAVHLAEPTLMADIKKEMRGMCPFCKQPVRINSDPFGERGIKTFPMLHGTEQRRYFHTQCYTEANCKALGVPHEPPLECFKCHQNLFGPRGGSWDGVPGQYCHKTCAEK